jgi:hypothetical protein
MEIYGKYLGGALGVLFKTANMCVKGFYRLSSGSAVIGGFIVVGQMMAIVLIIKIYFVVLISLKR